MNGAVTTVREHFKSWPESRESTSATHQPNNLPRRRRARSTHGYLLASLPRIVFISHKHCSTRSTTSAWRQNMGGKRPAAIGHVQATRMSGIGASASTALRVDRASVADAGQVVAVIAAAFLNDPTWSWAFPDPALRMRFWQVSIAGALRYRWVFRTEAFEAVSIWIPPDGTEFSPGDQARFPQLLTELVGSRASDVAELIRRFGEAHPRREPHYYLSLLGTAERHRGRGLGMALLRENLARIDAERIPAYLESSNPRNNHLYEAVGFKPVVSFQAPGGGPTVTGMWRPRAL